MAKRKAKQNLFSGFMGGDGYDEFTRNYLYYKNIALNVYKWENLPNGMESRFIEQALFGNGQAFFFDHPELGLMCLPCSGTGNINLYGEPTSVVVNGVGYSKQWSISKGVRILNNDSAIPTHAHVRHYAEKLAEIENIMNQNLRQQRFPYILLGNKRTEFSIKAMLRSVFQGDEAVMVDKDMFIDGKPGLQVINTDTPYLLDKLQVQKENYEKELLTFLGINSTVEKKERLLVDETNANNAYIEMSLDLGLKQREEAARKINQMFGTNIKVVATIHETKSLWDKNFDDDSDNEWGFR